MSEESRRDIIGGSSGETSHPFEMESATLNRHALDAATILSGRYWGELRTFLAVAKAKSLTRAADDLNTSHMTVGREIRRLQDAIGAQLAVVTKSGVTLTTRGRELATALLRFDQELYSLTNDLKSESKLAEGVVRISVTDGLGVVFVAPGLRTFSANFPRLQIHLKSPGNLKSLRENQTDLMIGFSPETANDLTSTPLGWLHFLPVASASYIERKGTPTSANLADHDFIESEIYSSTSAVWRPWHDAVAKGRVAHFCDASITYGIMVKAGVGIGLLGNYNLLEPSAVPLDLGCRISIPLYLVALTERLQSKPVKIVANFLSDLFGVANPWFAREMNLICRDERFNSGYAMLFNL